ncbi:hypothetical protein GCM10023149_52210 [Mucilaginibacter gynuensis]|uniref:Uncharacterized protein n=1 Tax=Mucilaginibacter gynuensis TaxID=1302236 RepID=A0ABP8HKM3_9SPHI
MKNLFALIFIAFAFALNTQAQSHSDNAAKPAYYLDSVKFGNSLETFVFDMDKIAEISVMKNEGPAGAVYIKSKNPADFNFLSLPQVALYYTGKKGPYLFMLNGKILTDISQIKIDASFIAICQKTNTKDIAYLKGTPAMSILNIQTRDKVKKETFIRGQGNESSAGR